MIPKTMIITHLGAETCVTGACHLIRFQPDQGGGSVAILVDCFIAYGHDPQVPFDRFPVPPADIDFLFLTHAHIDHIGRVPDLIDEGFRGEIICIIISVRLVNLYLFGYNTAMIQYCVLKLSISGLESLRTPEVRHVLLIKSDLLKEAISVTVRQ